MVYWRQVVALEDGAAIPIVAGAAGSVDSSGDAFMTLAAAAVARSNIKSHQMVMMWMSAISKNYGHWHRKRTFLD